MKYRKCLHSFTACIELCSVLCQCECQCGCERLLHNQFSLHLFDVQNEWNQWLLFRRIVESLLNFHWFLSQITPFHLMHAITCAWCLSEKEKKKRHFSLARTKSKCSISKFTVYNSFEMRLITCKTVIWWILNVFNMPLFPAHHPYARTAHHPHHSDLQDSRVCVPAHMLHNSIFGLPFGCRYSMPILITQPSKHINWNDIMYILHHFHTPILT